MLMAHWIMECFFNLGLYPFQPSQILSGQGIHLIDVPSLVTWSTWVTTLLLGVPRNKRLSLGPPLKLNIGIWPQLLLSSLGFVKCWRTLVFFFLPPPPPKLWWDNVSALTIVPNLVFHARTQHVEVHYHFVREKVLCKDLHEKYISTGDQLADIFTKSLSTSRFIFLKSNIMVSLDPMVLRGDVKVSTDSHK